MKSRNKQNKRGKNRKHTHTRQTHSWPAKSEWRAPFFSPLERESAHSSGIGKKKVFCCGWLLLQEKPHSPRAQSRRLTKKKTRQSQKHTNGRIFGIDIDHNKRKMTGWILQQHCIMGCYCCCCCFVIVILVLFV